ncbi:MAG: hypothetical protein H6719_27080 [Sandaracinaceae bacterium]|nr:hypothetical protein [Sandaracinaceae bacterium]
MTSTLVRALSIAALVSTIASPAAAQGGLGGRLDDPTGRQPVRRHEEPIEGVLMRVPDAYGDDVPEPPSYGAPVRSRTDAQLDDRLRVLDASWNVLGAQGLNYTNSVLSLIIGGAQVVVGGVFLEIGPPWDFIAPIFMVTGGVQVARTIIVDFILRPNPQPIALEYLGMASGTRQERLARLRYGEEQLESLATASATLRYVDSGLNVAGAGALVAAYFGMRDDRRDFDPVELIFFVGPAISLVMAVINLFTPSNAERRWDAYREMRERMGGDLVEVSPAISVDPHGGWAGLNGRF